MTNKPEGPSLTDYIGMYGGSGLGLIFAIWGQWEVSLFLLGIAFGIWVGGFANDLRRAYR